MVARRAAPRVRLDGRDRPLPALHRRDARGTALRATCGHAGPAQRDRALLLQRVRSCDQPGVDQRLRESRLRVEPRNCARHRGYRSRGRRRQRRAARAPARGDVVARPARRLTRRHPHRLQQLPRTAVAAALVTPDGRRLSVSPDLRRLRQHQPALVARRPDHRVHLEPLRQHRDLARGRRLGPSAAAGDRAAPIPRAASRADAGHRRRGGPAAARADQRDGQPRAVLCAGRCVGPRRRHADPGSAARGDAVFPLDGRQPPVRAARSPDDHGEPRTGVRSGAGDRHGWSVRLGPIEARDAPAADAAGGGAAALERRPARPHELRRPLPQHAGAPRRTGARRGSESRLQPDREQGAALPRHRQLQARSRSRVDERSADPSRTGVPHELLGTPGAAESHGAPAPARICRLSVHRRIESLSAQRRRRRHGAPAAGARRLRASVRRGRRSAEAGHQRAARRRGARQGRLLRSGRILRSEGDDGDLVSPARVRRAASRRRGHRCDGQLRQPARPGGASTAFTFPRAVR